MCTVDKCYFSEETMMKLLAFTLLFFLSMTSIAQARCVYDRKIYPLGSRIGQLVCQADGTWKPVKSMPPKR